MNDYLIFKRDLRTLYRSFVFNVFLVIGFTLLFVFQVLLNPVYFDMLISMPKIIFFSFALIIIFLINAYFSAVELKSFLDIKKGSVFNGDF